MEGQSSGVNGGVRRISRHEQVRVGATPVVTVRWLGLLAALILQPAWANEAAPTPSPGGAELAQAVASQPVRHLADRIFETADNHRLPFLIVDKVDARVFVFDATGKLRGAAPALLGLARGDDSAANIRDHKLSEIGPQSRVTPAGRFVASIGHDSAGKEVLWIDYDNSIALHPVVTSHPKERRLERLASPLPLEHRISWGCINVPSVFYETVVSPTFAKTQGIVYVLPETRAASEVFAFD